MSEVLAQLEKKGGGSGGALGPFDVWTIGGNGNSDHYGYFEHYYDAGKYKKLHVGSFECSGAGYVRNSFIKKLVNGSWVTILSKTQNQGNQTYNQDYDISDSTGIQILACGYGQGQSQYWKGLILS